VVKVYDEVKQKGKGSWKRTKHATIVELRGISKLSVGRKILCKCLRNSKARIPKNLGAAVEEEHLLSFVDMCDNVCMQVDIEEAYVLAPIVSIDYGFGDLTDDEHILDLETPTECENKEEVSKWKAGCSSKASLHCKGHEDHNNDVEPPMSIYEDSDVEVEYEFHNNVAFVQNELGLEEEDVEEVQG
jgi:hypothetical protein